MADPTRPPSDPFDGALPPGASACLAVRGYLPLYVGGDLDGPQIAAVRAHLDECAACACESRAAEAARAAIRSIAEPAGGGVRAEDPIDVWRAVRAELSAEGLLERRSARLWSSRPAARTRRPVRWVAAALAAAAAIAVGIELSTGGPASTPGRGQAEPAALADVETSAPVLPVAAPLAPATADGLRRAGPDEERLRNRALPFDERGRGGAADGGWSLAGDRRLK